MNALSRSRCGRIILHMLCAMRDRHLRWHWQGILRELPH